MLRYVSIAATDQSLHPQSCYSSYSRIQNVKLRIQRVFWGLELLHTCFTYFSNSEYSSATDGNLKCQTFDNLRKRRRIWCRPFGFFESQSLSLTWRQTIIPPSILTFSRLTARHRAIVRGRRCCQKHSLQGDPSSNTCCMHARAHTHTHKQRRSLLLCLSAEGKASKQVKALS